MSVHPHLCGDIVEEYSDHLLLSLRKNFKTRIHEETKHWLQKDKKYQGFEMVLKLYHPNWRKIQVKKKLMTT